MNSKSKHKEYIFDSVLVLFIIQLSRIFINYILYSQLNESLFNFIITSIISFMLIMILLLLILKNNKKFTRPHFRFVSIFDKQINHLSKLLTIILAIIICIVPCFKGGYTLYNIKYIILFIIIIPIFDELIFREYIWNYKYFFIKDINKIFLSTTLLYAIFKFGYVDIIIKYMKLTYSTSYLIDIISLTIISSIIIGSILNFIKIKLKNINMCIIVHISINILIFLTNKKLPI